MVVLDTQAWLWWAHDPDRLSQPAARAIQKAQDTDGIRVSVISVWEVALKSEIGKLELCMDIDEWFRQASSYPNLMVEALSAQDAIACTRLPGDFHRDPADRMIVAMCRRYGAALVTSDRLIRAYPYVNTIW